MVSVGWMKGIAVLGGCAVGLAGLLAQQAKVAPEVVSPGTGGIGRLVVLPPSETIDGRDFNLRSEAKATVIALTDLSCPLTKKFAPTLAALEDEYKAKGVRFVFLNPNASEDRAEILVAIKELGFDGEYIWDAKGALAASLGATTTTEAFLLDSSGTLVYRGAVDDQYGLGYQIDAPKNTYLADAIDAVLGGAGPKVECTSAPGCALMLDAKPATRAVTYHDQVARVLQRNCVTCHHDGGVGPFALDTFEKATAFKGMVKQVVGNGTMPPWYAAPTEDGHSPWENDRSLTKQDKSDLMAWIDGGCPEGDPKLSPIPLTFSTEWAIGKPDYVFQIPFEREVRATGQMPYYHVRIDTNFDEDKWVDALEVHPTDRSVVHHVLVFIVEGGKIGGRGLLDVDESTGFLMGYVPGTDHVVFPDGQAKRIPKGATLLFQIHYTPNGKATKDQTRMAVHFAKEPPKNELQVYGIVNRTFAIPPGDPAYSNQQTVTAPADLYVTSLMAHMHVRGKAFKFEATYPDGKKEVLLDVPKYDFNWQITYRYKEPKFLPAGTKITATGTFDNSDKNPSNPDPTRTVHWGLQTTEEMLLGYVEYYVPGAKPGQVVTLGGG